MNLSEEEFEAAVKTMLLQDWDPIGVGDIPEAQDEYDVYVLEVCKMLRAGRGVDLYSYLIWVEKERMGLVCQEALTKNVAEKLIKLR
jgi:hypothetical protein